MFLPQSPEWDHGYDLLHPAAVFQVPSLPSLTPSLRPSLTVFQGLTGLQPGALLPPGPCASWVNAPP